MKRLSPGRSFMEGVWEGELLHWGPWKICWRALEMGHHSVRDSIRGPGGLAPLLGNLKDEVFERYAKCPLNGPPSP